MSGSGWFTLRWDDDAVRLLDQRRLPGVEVYLALRDVEEIARAIEELAVRGAPAIGCAAALGVARAAVTAEARDARTLAAALEPAFTRLARTRPTAVNLFWALRRMRQALGAALAAPGASAGTLRQALVSEARSILEEDVAICRAIGRAGLELVPDGARVLTHCNAGALTTAGYGTALGVLRAAVDAGRRISVLADETRPFLQGARLTAWELARDGIPVSVVTDGMAGHLMQRGEVDLVLVGADRVAANGDVANKIGTPTEKSKSVSLANAMNSFAFADDTSPCFSKPLTRHTSDRPDATIAHAVLIAVPGPAPPFSTLKTGFGARPR